VPRVPFGLVRQGDYPRKEKKRRKNRRKMDVAHQWEEGAPIGYLDTRFREAVNQ